MRLIYGSFFFFLNQKNCARSSRFHAISSARELEFNNKSLIDHDVYDVVIHIQYWILKVFLRFDISLLRIYTKIMSLNIFKFVKLHMKCRPVHHIARLQTVHRIRTRLENMKECRVHVFTSSWDNFTTQLAAVHCRHSTSPVDGPTHSILTSEKFM